MAFTEFCCRSGGSNLNSGTRTGSSTEPGTSADFTYASGNWVASTGVFTVASGNPSSDGVAVGDFASVYADGSSTTGFVGRVTARDTTTITVSLTVKSGTAPTDGTGNRTLKVGGAWAGPSGATIFPFGFFSANMKQSADDAPRCNFKNDQTYSVSASCNHNTAEAVALQILQGYTTSYGDGGRAVFDGGSNAISGAIIDGSEYQIWVEDIEVKSTATTGTTHGFRLGRKSMCRRCVAQGVRGLGFTMNNAVCAYIECEAYNCNKSNTVGWGGFGVNSSGVMARRCYAHDNTGSNNAGFVLGALNVNVEISNCVSHKNQYGAYVTGTPGSLGIQVAFFNCDFYNNASDGIRLNWTSSSLALLILENCNLVKNGGYGINDVVATYTPTVYLQNCAFGTGTKANTSGNTAGVAIYRNQAPVTLASGVTPWQDPDNGDFRIALASNKGTGRGTWFQTASGLSGTVGYPDIGAAQHQDSGGNIIVPNRAQNIFL